MSWSSPESHRVGLDEVYPRLRRIAKEMLSKEYRQPTMQGTELVHEALMRLRNYRGLVTNSSHYLSISVAAMKRILIDRSRRRTSQKRTPSEVGTAVVQPESERVMAVRLAFQRLRGYDRELGTVVQLHFFEGHTLEETAVRMQLNVSRVRQLLTFAEAWLKNEFAPNPAMPPDDDPIRQLQLALRLDQNGEPK